MTTKDTTRATRQLDLSLLKRLQNAESLYGPLWGVRSRPTTRGLRRWWDSVGESFRDTVRGEYVLHGADLPRVMLYAIREARP